MALEPIWPKGFKIEVVGVTGAYGSGKSLWVLTIDPANTLYFDFEKSGALYEQLGMERIDVPEVLREKHKGKAYTPLDMFKWWLDQIRKIEPGKYSVIATDPISDIEDGLVDWVASRYKEFGFSSESKFKDMGGVFWGRVKSEWKRVLLNDIATKCQTFAFTTHLRQVFKFGKPVHGQTEAKGKATLRETASLYLTLDRSPLKKGEEPPIQPRAVVDKNRLSVITMKDGVTTITPALPPAIETCTPQRIREYILNPPDYGNLKEGEQEVVKELTKQEELLLQQEIADTNREAAEAQERAIEKQAKMASAREKALSALRPKDEPQEEATQPEAAQQDQEVKEDAKDGVLRDEDAVRGMLRTAHGKGISDRVLKGVWTTLKERGVDVSGFKVETAVEFTRQLTQEEFEKFQRNVENFSGA